MRKWICSFAVLMVAACGPADPAREAEARQAAGNAGKAAKKGGRPLNTAALPPGVFVLTKAVIQDPGVIASGPALSVLLPAGWSTRGGVIMPQGLCAEPYAVDWSASSPDGAMSVGIFPTEVWQHSSTSMHSDCKPGNFANVRDYLSARVAQAFPGARVIDYRPRPDFAKAASERAQQTQAMAAGMGLGMKAWADGGEVLFAYNANGQEMRGVMGASAIFYGNSLQNPMGGPPLTTLTGTTLGTFAATAPNGKLDFQLVEAVRRSISPDPNWLQRLFSIQNQRGQIAVQGTRERAAMIVAGGAEATQRNIQTFQMMAQSGRNAQTEAADDRMQRERIEGIRGVETYHDPVGETNVQLDATYSNAWRVNNHDAYILTNDPNFNPGQYDIQATQMQALP